MINNSYFIKNLIINIFIILFIIFSLYVLKNINILIININNASSKISINITF